jgi:hypothetical protein
MASADKPVRCLDSRVNAIDGFHTGMQATLATTGSEVVRGTPQ